MENFASSVLELQAVLKNAGESDGARYLMFHDIILLFLYCLGKK